MDRLITQYLSGLVFCAVALCALITSSASAIAQTPAVDKRVSPKALPPRGAESITAPSLIRMPVSEALGPPVARLAKTALQRRLVLELDVGVHLCAGSYCRYSTAHLAVRSSVLYAARRYMAVGLHVAFLMERVSGLPNGELDTNKDLLGAAEYRVRIPVKRVLLWAGLALGYVYRERQSIGGGATRSDQDMVMGLGLGTDLFVSSSAAFGIATWLYYCPTLVELHWILGVGVRFNWVPRPR